MVDFLFDEEEEIVDEPINFDEEGMQSDRRKDGSNLLGLEHALEYAQKDFLFHADQRFKLLRNYLIYLVAVTAGFYTLYRTRLNDLNENEIQNADSQLYILCMFSLISLCIVLILWRLECRNSALVCIGKDACLDMENKVINYLPNDVCICKEIRDNQIKSILFDKQKCCRCKKKCLLNLLAIYPCGCKLLSNNEYYEALKIALHSEKSSSSLRFLSQLPGTYGALTHCLFIIGIVIHIIVILYCLKTYFSGLLEFIFYG